MNKREKKISSGYWIGIKNSSVVFVLISLEDVTLEIIQQLATRSTIQYKWSQTYCKVSSSL